MNPIPKPLHQKLVLTLLVGIGCFFTGLALSVSIRDKTLFFLSAAILVFSCIRTVSLYFKIKSGSYYTLEGTCCSVFFLPFRKNYTAALTDRDGRDRILHLPKDCRVRPGLSYRFYFQCPPDFLSGQNAFLEKSYLSDNLLGIEPIAELTQNIDIINS